MKFIILHPDKSGLKIVNYHTQDNARKRQILRGIFYTLLEIVHDMKNNNFYCSWNLLTKLSGISRESLRKYTPVLEELKLIKVEDDSLDFSAPSCEEDLQIRKQRQIERARSVPPQLQPIPLLDEHRRLRDYNEYKKMENHPYE